MQYVGIGGGNSLISILLDVGRGEGHDLEEFRAKHPHMQRRLVLQERPFILNRPRVNRHERGLLSREY